ncbi:hypothetical protein [Brevibacillus fulvus]|uniref:Uncharacterized protein n=1 Tax=Brevibacillus fulvus TaxID=1125967 RepID=A0A938XYK3_9BACL|nr:hypothetical protein [Brevibacillus fulvus]MBM7590008.1 hypothetical protein [Brevibacillus fulvus]
MRAACFFRYTAVAESIVDWLSPAIVTPAGVEKECGQIITRGKMVSAGI